jgi:hypothetical protein
VSRGEGTSEGERENGREGNGVEERERQWREVGGGNMSAVLSMSRAYELLYLRGADDR